MSILDLPDPGSRARRLPVLTLLLLVAALGAAEDPLPVTFFYAPGCRMCVPTKAAVRTCEQRFGGRIAVEWVDTSDSAAGAANVRRLWQLLDARGIEDNPSLALFTPRQALTGGERIIAEAEAALAAELSGAVAAADGEAVRSDRFGWLAITGAGLADGINPCAFATIVLFLAMLLAARRSRREILLVGGGFILTVYTTYFLLGLGLYELLGSLRVYHLLSDLVFLLAVGLCLIGALLSLWDASLALRGRPPKQMLLRVPDRLQERMRRHLRKGARAPSLLVAAVATGFTVSLLEAVCTGQVYFPVIASLLRRPGGRSEALVKLLWYNLCFVLPLAVVVGAVAGGASNRTFERLGERYWGWSKLLLALIFSGLAWYMVHATGLPWPPGAR